MLIEGIDAPDIYGKRPMHPHQLGVVEPVESRRQRQTQNIPPGRRYKIRVVVFGLQHQYIGKADFNELEPLLDKHVIINFENGIAIGCIGFSAGYTQFNYWANRLRQRTRQVQGFGEGRLIGKL